LIPLNDDDEDDKYYLRQSAGDLLSSTKNMMASLDSPVAGETEKGEGSGEDTTSTTSAAVQEQQQPTVAEIPTSTTTTSTPTTSTPTAAATAERAKKVFGSLKDNGSKAFESTSKAFNSFVPQLMQKKYTLPDKTVASQVLMYRQLLHTKCRPGLRLSRPYEATAAQKAVKHMPWWEQGIDESRKMVISYDNLIVRLWMNGAIMPFDENAFDTLLDDNGLPPIPHDFWVHRLGFQQPDPVTDFRSGGVLSLAMMVYLTESHPTLVARFFQQGDCSVLPFGITSINVTDMISKFLMLAKSTDKMDALLSQKPFWRMFADPNAILAVQELSISMLCDVVVELKREYAFEASIEPAGTTNAPKEVTVFDFSKILETTEKRVKDDLLGAGPKTVLELRTLHVTLKTKYQTDQVERHKKVLERKRQEKQNTTKSAVPMIGTVPMMPSAAGMSVPTMSPPSMAAARDLLGGAAANVSAASTGLFSKLQTSGANLLQRGQQAGASVATAAAATAGTTPAAADLIDLDSPTTTTTDPTNVLDDLLGDGDTATATISSPTSNNNNKEVKSEDSDWSQLDDVTDAVGNFSIGDDDDDDDDL